MVVNVNLLKKLTVKITTYNFYFMKQIRLNITYEELCISKL